MSTVLHVCWYLKYKVYINISETMPSSNCPNTSVTDLTWYNEHHEKLTLTDEIIDNLSNNNSNILVYPISYI